MATTSAASAASPTAEHTLARQRHDAVDGRRRIARALKAARVGTIVTLSGGDASARRG